jgi:hypothetical protein
MSETVYFIKIFPVFLMIKGLVETVKKDAQYKKSKSNQSLTK